jgi:sphingomyelin phosphodiesterase
VLTYNVFTVLGAVGVRQRMALIGASDHMRGYDVVILNELFNDSASEHLLEVLSAEYPYQTSVLARDSAADPACASNDCWTSSEGGFVSGRPEDGGVAIVSKWPIQERRQYVFQATCDIDALSSKGFVYVRLDMNGKMVHVIGTHLEADPSDLGALGAQMLAMYPCPNPGDVPTPPNCAGESQTPYEAVRLAQLMEMTAWIEQQNIPKEQMVLIGGDLTWIKSATRRNISGCSAC